MATRRTDDQLDREIDEGIARGARMAATDPRATEAWYDAGSGRIMVELTNGVIFGFPPELGQGLRGATAEDLATVEIEGGGYGTARRAPRCGTGRIDRFRPVRAYQVGCLVGSVAAAIRRGSFEAT